MALPNRLVAPSSASSTSAFVASRSTGWEESDGFELMDSTSIAVVGLPDDEGLDDFEVIADIDSEDFANLLVEDFEDEGKTLDRTGPHRFLDDLETVDLTADPSNTVEASQPDSEAGSDTSEADLADASKSEKRKVIQPKRTTERDMDILRGIHWMERATTIHVAYLVQAPSSSVWRRLTELRDRGLLMRIATDDVIQWGLTVKGLRMIGETGNAKENPKRSTIAHRNKKNSIIVHLLTGGQKMAELEYREALDALRIVRSKNSRTVLHNELLAAKQEEIRRIPERQRTEKEMRTLRRKPGKIKPEVEPIQKIVPDHPFESTPQAAFSESVIVRDFQIWGWNQVMMDWDSEAERWLESTGFPVRQPGDLSPVTEAERKALSDSVTAKAWLFNHWNLNSKFEKKHQPDGVLLLPHRVQPDGSILPGSYWIEMEDSRKQLTEVVRVCKQAMDHPLVRGAIYFTNDLAIANLISRAKKQVASDLAQRYRSTQGMTTVEAQAQAEAEVNDAILVKKSPLLNPNANGSGFWG